MSSLVRHVIATLPTDASSIDVTLQGETRTPTGCVIIGGWVSRADVEEVQEAGSVRDEVRSFGMTDFATQSVIATSSEDGQTPADTSCQHATNSVFRLLNPGGQAINRSATATPIIGGVRITTGEVGADFVCQVMMVFEAECKHFSGGNGINQNQTFSVAHGLSGPPNAAIYFSTNINEGATNDAQGNIGFHADQGAFKQVCAARLVRQGGGSVLRALVSDAYVGLTQQNNGQILTAWELTGNDAVNTTFTVRVGASGNGTLTGLLIYLPDVEADVDILATPTVTTGGWNYTGLNWSPQFSFLVPTGMANVNQVVGNPQCNSMGSVMFDEGANLSGINATSQITVEPSACATAFDGDNIFSSTTTGGRNLNAQAVFSGPNGFIINPADLLGTESTARQWPALFIEKFGAVTPPATLSNPTGAPAGSSEADGTVDTDITNGTLYAVVTRSATTPSHAQIRAGQDHTGAAADDARTRNANLPPPYSFRFRNLQESTIYFAHYTQESATATPAGNQISSTSFTTLANNPPESSPIPDQTVTEGISFALDIKPFFSDPDGDTLTYAGMNMPNGLAMDPVNGIISGVPTGGIFVQQPQNLQWSEPFPGFYLLFWDLPLDGQPDVFVIERNTIIYGATTQQIFVTGEPGTYQVRARVDNRLSPRSNPVVIP